MKNKIARIPLGLKVFLMSILMAFIAGTYTFAEHQEGVVTNVRKQLVFGGDQMRLWVYVDTDSNRIADTILAFPDPRTNSMSGNLETFIEKGMSITFDDNAFFIENNMKRVDGNNTKTIDGTNMLDLFPNEAERFKFAAQARATIRPATPVSPPSAEERRIAELEAELQRLKQGK